MKRLFIVIIVLGFLATCNGDYEQRLKVSVNSWVGYTPVFYAYDKGWLEDYNIEVLNLVSLAESMYLYESGNSDALTGTQYEYKQLKKNHPDLTVLMLFDRSDGGDMILSNLSIEELKQTDKVIYVYLEIDSVNSELIKDFLNYYQLGNHPIHYINQDQAVISQLKYIPPRSPVILVTYVPYNFPLLKQGYKIISSTREKNVISVIDALYATQETLKQHQKQFKQLKKEIDRALVVLKENPQEFYKHVKYYIGDISYPQFLVSLKDIKWLNDKSAAEIKKQLPGIEIPLNGLL